MLGLGLDLDFFPSLLGRYLVISQSDGSGKNMGSENIPPSVLIGDVLVVLEFGTRTLFYTYTNGR